MLPRRFILAGLNLLFSTVIFCQASVPLWGNLKPGPHHVGFKVISERDKNGKPFLVSLWYPSEKEGSKMTLKDYVETGLWNGREDKASLSNAFKETIELPFLFGINKLSAG